jgi:hypothetical protein
VVCFGGGAPGRRGRGGGPPPAPQRITQSRQIIVRGGRGFQRRHLFFKFLPSSSMLMPPGNIRKPHLFSVVQQFHDIYIDDFDILLYTFDGSAEKIHDMTESTCQFFRGSRHFILCKSDGPPLVYRSTSTGST